MPAAGTDTPEVSPLAVTYALNAAQVQIGTPNGPGVMIAPYGTAPPIDTKTAWGVGWQVLGYMSDAGPVLAQATTKQDIVPWQSTAPLRSPITARSITAQFVMWQLNDLTMALYFDATRPTPSATDGSFSMPVASGGGGFIYAIGIDAKDGNQVMRIIFTRANLSAAGNMALTRGAAVPLDVTLSALDDNGTLCTVLLGTAT